MINVIEKIRKHKQENTIKENIKTPKSVQDTIPIKRIYSDGIFELNEENRYSKTFSFTDVNFAVAGQSEKEDMILKYGEVLNSLDIGASSKLTIINRKFNKVDFENKVKLQVGNDNLSNYRNEFNKILSENSINSDGMIQEKLLTISANKKDIKEARSYFTRTGVELASNFAKINSKLTDLNLQERLRLFYDFYRKGEEDLYNFDLETFMKKGHSFKDYISPSTMEFKTNYFKLGERFGRVLYIKEYASFISDDIISELTDLNKNMMLSIDIKPIPPEEALKMAERIMLGVDTNITKWQQKQNKHNNFSANIPFDLQQQREESNDFLNDLKSRDQKVFLSTIVIVHTAESKEELDEDTKTLISVAQKHSCQLEVLNFQQLDGLNTALPFGVDKIKSKRTLTTESLAIFSPYKVQEIQDVAGIYYGINKISKNLMLINRQNLQNGNSFILGVSGSGKSFTAKLEITSIALKDKNADIIIVDPEEEYQPLIKALNGEVIKISSTSSNHINALDLNRDYDEKSPIVKKSEFILSLCEQVIGSGVITPIQKTIIDRCTKLVYRYYEQGNYQGIPPTLEDFRQELKKQPEKEAREIALALELFTTGSLNTFSKYTNVEINNRLVCFDIKDLGEQLMPIGMLVILDSILNRIAKNRKKGKTTYIFIDEIYLLFKHNYTSTFVAELWKRVRKYGGCATGITQNVEEILNNEKGKLMLSNSEFLILLNQSSSDREKISELLNMNEMETSYITNANTGEGIIKVRSALIPFENKFPRNTELYKLMTTKINEKI